jgi:hypothetical protein
LRDSEAVRQTAHKELAPIALSIGRKENAGCQFFTSTPGMNASDPRSGAYFFSG